MGNWWSSTAQRPRVRYDVVLPTSCRAWELLYSGDINTWDAVAAHYGMDKYAYCCGLSSCDREAVCLRYIKATLKSDNQTIAVERYKSSSVHVPVSTCPGIKQLLADGFRLNEVAMAQRKELVLLVMQMAQQFINQVAFPLIHLGCPDDDVDSGNSSRKEAERPRLLRRLSSKRDAGKGEGRKRTNSSSVDSRRCQGKDLNRNASSSSSGGGGDGGGGGAVPGEKRGLSA